MLVRGFTLLHKHQVNTQAAAAARNDDEGGNDRFGRRGDDFLSSRRQSFFVSTPQKILISCVGCLADRQAAPPREDVPLPTQPPYTAFVGNLAFDLTEAELGDFFVGIKVHLRCLPLDKLYNRRCRPSR